MMKSAVSATLLILGLAATPLEPQPAASAHALVGARVVGVAGSPAIDDATILIQNGRIQAIGPRASVRVPPSVPTTSLAGTFVVPGLISAHAHVTNASTLRQLGVFARYGITTVWSLGGEGAPAFQARAEQSGPGLDRARIYLAGDVITGQTPGDARAAVARVAAMKPDVIKIRVDDTLGTTAKMTPDVYKAVIDEAHTRGLRVAAHIFYLDDAKELLRAGADVIAHSVRDREVDEEFLALLKSRQAAYIPTLTRELSTFVYESTPAFFSDPFFLKEADPALVAQLKDPARQAGFRNSPAAQRYKAGLEIAKRNLKRVSDAGGLVAMGTDAGPLPERFQGYFEHVEMEMMVDAGLTPSQALRAATVDAARAMRVDGVGALSAGAWADVLALKEDPSRDIRNSRQIAGVWIAGNAVKR